MTKIEIRDVAVLFQTEKHANARNVMEFWRLKFL
jgi:hypothetical protein